MVDTYNMVQGTGYHSHEQPSRESGQSRGHREREGLADQQGQVPDKVENELSTGIKSKTAFLLANL